MLKLNSWRKPWPKASDEEVDLVADLYRQQLLITEISSLTGLTRHQIDQRLRRAGIRRNRRQTALIVRERMKERLKREAQEGASSGELLAYFRGREGLSMAELGRRSGVSAGHLSRIERGEREASRKIMERLASSLDLSDEERARWGVANGYIPPQSIEWATVVELVSTTRNQLAPHQQAKFDEQVTRLVEWWQQNGIQG